jgi:hypothetical protein
LFDRLRGWNKYDDHQNLKKSVEKSPLFSKLHKQIELIGIEVKGLDEKTETGRLELKTKFINQHFINELDKIGLQFINIRGTWLGSLVILLEYRNLNLTSDQ